MIGIFRGAMTLILLLFFVAIVAWAWSGRRKAVFDSMARMALDDDSQPTSNLPTVKEAHHE
ncbi:MAG: cbb3-type cytochrome c oxidase subunit 3 [Steroidobacteraceae bacterium]|jgi:cbb3-type cytochrome oxidase subunit 3